MVLPSRQITRVQSIVTFDGELDAAVLSQSVTLQLEDEIDISRGDMLVSPERSPGCIQALQRCARVVGRAAAATQPHATS